MLGDNHEKSKNPLKKAMRRRNAKTVVFAATPSYREPSGTWDSSEDENGDGEYPGHDDEATEEQESTRQTVADSNEVVAPLNAPSSAADSRLSGQTMVDHDTADRSIDEPAPAEMIRASEDTIEQSGNTTYNSEIVKLH